MNTMYNKAGLNARLCQNSDVLRKVVADHLIFRKLMSALCKNPAMPGSSSRIDCPWLWLTYPILFYWVRNEELRSTVKLQLESPKETTQQAQAGNQIPTLCTEPEQARDPLVSEWHSANRAFPSKIALRSLRDRGLLSEDQMLQAVAVEAEKHLRDPAQKLGEEYFIGFLTLHVL